MEKAKLQDFSIDWKRHDDFFISLNTKLDEISTIGEACYLDIKNIHTYYAKVRNLYNKHSAYIQDPKKMKNDLDLVEKGIYNVSLLKDLKEGKEEAEQFRMRQFKRVQEILTQMIEDFTIPELIPKPIKQDKPMSKVENLTDEERAEFEALEEIGIKYKIVGM